MTEPAFVAQANSRRDSDSEVCWPIAADSQSQQYAQREPRKDGGGRCVPSNTATTESLEAYQVESGAQTFTSVPMCIGCVSEIPSRDLHKER